MEDILPAEVIKKIQEQFRKASVVPEDRFEDAEADEDSLTGVLVERLGDGVRGKAQTSAMSVSWTTRFKKLRGRGNNAPEKLLGADAILELEIKEEETGKILRRKILPVQAKTEWHGNDRNLLNQAKKMEEIIGDSLVVDYRRNGTLAARAHDVVTSGGNRGRLSPDLVRPLGDILANDFVRCLIGNRHAYYDAVRELLVLDGLAQPMTVGHRARTTVALSGPSHRLR